MVRLPGYDHTRSLPANLALDFLWGLRVARHLPPGDIVACNTVSLPAYLPIFKPSAGRVAVVLGRMPKGHAHFYGRVHRLIATSDAVRAEVIRERPRLAARTRVFPNPIDWVLHQQPRHADPVLTIGYVGRLNPEKGLELLLRAAAELARRDGLPAWRLRLVVPQSIAEGGGGEAYVAGLRQLAARTPATISFEPPVYDPLALARIYSTFDLFCYPSLAEKGEGLSVAPLEAMAAGAVPVVSALDCYRDVIRDGENGSIFDHRAADHVTRLADRLGELLRDNAARERMAAQARRDAQRFDYATVAAELLADFAQLGGEPQP